MSLFSTGYAGLNTTPPTILPARSWHGTIRGVYDVYAPGVSIAAGWVVRIARIPAGSRIYGGLIEITNSFGSAVTQANFGFTGAPTQFLTNQSIAAVTQVPIDREARGAGSIVPGVNGTDTDLIMTVVGVTSPVATGRLTVYVTYQL